MIRFRHRPGNALEEGGQQPLRPAPEEELMKTCPNCHRQAPVSVIGSRDLCCPHCAWHFPMSARRRIRFLTDGESFQELDGTLTGGDPLLFPGYAAKLSRSREISGEREGVVCGTAAVLGNPCALFVMEGNFMMGSMGTVVGEKLTRLFGYAAGQGLPVVGYTVSGGARMQEGLLSLMQMAKVSAAVRRHSDRGLFYLTVLTHPTTGGVTASFAMEGDIILAEPGATVGFAGGRVIEQTTRKKLPRGFQTAEFQQEHGFVDAIIPRQTQRQTVGLLLELHSGRN